MDIKIEKREGKNTKDEKQEITVSIHGRIVLYGDEVLKDFESDFAALVNQYAI